jgi:hypothetical protein
VAASRHAEQHCPADLPFLAKLKHVVGERPGKPRPKAAAHQDVGLHGVLFATVEAHGMIGPDGDEVVDVGAKGDAARVALSFDRHFDGEERRVLDGDAEPLNRRHEHETLGIAA